MKKERGDKIIKELEDLGIIDSNDKKVILLDYSSYLKKSKKSNINKEKKIKDFEKKNKKNMTKKNMIDYFVRLLKSS